MYIVCIIHVHEVECGVGMHFTKQYTFQWNKYHKEASSNPFLHTKWDLLNLVYTKCDKLTNPSSRGTNRVYCMICDNSLWLKAKQEYIHYIFLLYRPPYMYVSQFRRAEDVIIEYKTLIIFILKFCHWQLKISINISDNRPSHWSNSKKAFQDRTILSYNDSGIYKI